MVEGDEELRGDCVSNGQHVRREAKKIRGETG
jgi:hypothetical protein